MTPEHTGDTLSESTTTTEESRLVRCTDCGRLHPATLTDDRELVPVASHACKTCRNDEFEQVVLDIN